MTTGTKSYWVMFNGGNFQSRYFAESREACYRIVLNELQNGDPYLTHDDEERNIFGAVKKDTIFAIEIMEEE